MRTVNRTYSMPIDLDHDLRLLVGRRHISGFVAESVRKNLAKLSDKLAKEYTEASEDEDRKEVIKEWECTTADGLGEDNAW